MSETPITKKYPSAPPEIGEVLGFNKTDDSHANTAHAEASDAHLPVVDSHAVKPDDSKVAHTLPHQIETLEEAQSKQPAWQKALRSVAPYFAVFAVGIVLYYFFLSKTDISSILDKIKPVKTAVQSPKETALQTLEKQNTAAYQTWISQYYFDVSDTAVIDPNADNSGNGLSNFQKFLLNLNPRSYDTLGLGMADSQAIAQGVNPLTGGKLNDAQKSVIDKYFDMEVVMNRLAISNLNNSRNVAGASVTSNSAQQSNQINQNFQTNQGNINNQQGQTSINQTNFIAPATGPQVAANDLDIDQSKPGLLEIPSLKITAPLMWTQDPKNFDNDLQSGVVHYPGTALPGQTGTAYISGHSSNYIWAKGSYNHIFTHLDNLANNTSFSITVYLKDGKSAKLHFVVTRRQEYSPTDQSQFQNAGVPTVALSTCWPVNTTQKRLVVFGELTQVEK